MLAGSRFVAIAFVIASCWTCAKAQEFEVIRVDTSLVAVNVTVTDSKNRHLRDLKVENFNLKDQGRPVQIEFFDNQGPASIVFVIDTSASMYGERWEHLKKGLKRFLKHSREDNDYTLIIFDDYPRLVAESVSPKELWKHLEKPNKKGHTALYDALLMGLEVIGRLQRRQKALVLLSDGQDNRSQAQLSDVQLEAKARRTTIYAVGISPSPRHLLPDEKRGKEILKQLADGTGGLASFPHPWYISKTLEGIQTDLNSQYTLSYYASDKTPGWRTVQVNLTSSLQPVLLRYQQRYLMRGEVEDHAKQNQELNNLIP